MPLKMKLIELFSGTGSVGEAFQEIKYDVVSVDISDKFEHTCVADVLIFDYTVFPSGHFDVVWASCPCTEYSCAKTIDIRDFVGADRLVEGALEIINYLKPKYWWLENPATSLLHMRPCMQYIGKP